MTFTTKRPDEETPLLAEEGGKDSAPKERSPIPWGQFSILLILQLAEPLTSQVISPFAPQLIRDVGVTHGDETKVGYFVGMMHSLFFATQALTVLHWSSISDHIGRKPVILTGLIGIALSMYSLGLSTTFPTIVISRCLNGALNGNIGVLKSQFGSLFDDTNMAYAYAWLPLAWSTGSTLGPMIGGSLSHPVDRFPSIFGNSTFLRAYPYFLPCAVPATFAAFAWVITFFFLKETVSSPKSIARLFRLRTSRANLVLQNVVEGGDPSVACDEQPPPAAAVDGKEEERPYPLRELLTRDVIIAGGNYASLSLVDIAYRAIQPVFYATPIELGGLGLTPPQIGAILSVYGITSGLFQIFFFAKINASWGSKNTFIVGVGSMVLLYGSIPAISVLASNRGVDSVVLAAIGLQLLIAMLPGLAYGCIFIFITTASPNRASLGSTNGLCQMVVSWMRAFGPALANSMYSLSLKEDTWTVYWVLEGLAVAAIMGACLLPRTPWKK